MYEKLMFTDEAGEQVEFYILEQTRINGMNYLLVVDSSVDLEEDSDEEVEAMIVKDISDEEDSEAIYEIVTDENEIESVSKLFDELLEEIDFE